MTPPTLDTQIDQLSQAEKVRVFQRLARDLTQRWPGVRVNRPA